jgi:hypothetical protein
MLLSRALMYQRPTQRPGEHEQSLMKLRNLLGTRTSAFVKLAEARQHVSSLMSCEHDKVIQRVVTWASDSRPAYSMHPDQPPNTREVLEVATRPAALGQ